MRIFWNDNHMRHHPAGEMKDGVMRPPFEYPGRLQKAQKALVKAGFAASVSPTDHGREPLKRVHSSDYLDFLESAYGLWLAEGRSGDLVPLVWPDSAMRRDIVPETIDGRIGLYCFDNGTPITAGSWDVVYRAAQCAVSAADHTGQGQHSFAFTRPPGHHAMPAAYGGYCFINNAAVAAQALRDRGAERIAILDVDYHHGNGTQAIFYARGDVLVVNIHADPAHEYPYYIGHSDEKGIEAGEGATLNLPLRKGATWAQYSPALETALARITEYGADALVLSYGADTFDGDPLGRFHLRTSDMQRIGDRVAALGLPTTIILEGGYDTDALGDNIAAVLQAFD